VAHRLGDAAIDPPLWFDVMEEICQTIGATGAALLQSDVRTADCPPTAGIDNLFRDYFVNNWYIRDLARAASPYCCAGKRSLSSQDCVTPEELLSSARPVRARSPRMKNASLPNLLAATLGRGRAVHHRGDDQRAESNPRLLSNALRYVLDTNAAADALPGRFWVCRPRQIEWLGWSFDFLGCFRLRLVRI
jgi:hypothetical protein